MKPPLKPPFDAAGKRSSAGSRPAFPVQLNSGNGSSFATKKVAAYARTTSGNGGNGLNGLNDLKKPFQPGASAGLGLDSAVRARMVRRLAEQGVLDAQVLAAMGTVQRHHFVDSALAGMAYDDTSLPIGFGQTISKPNVVARMLELLQHGLTDGSGRLGRVLEIGTGCGYQAAVLEPPGHRGLQHGAPARPA